MIKNKSLSVAGDQPASAEQGSKGVLKLGLDMHYRQVSVAMQENNGPLKAVGKLSHDGFWAWLEKKYKEGWEIYSCYEAGASGYWLHRDLVGLGVNNQVVAPKATGQDRRQKTDRRDSAELLDCLDQDLRGKKTALHPVAIPSPELEQNRALVRYHRQLMADRSRCESRGKGLLCAQGIELSGKWWSTQAGKELKTHPRCKDWIEEQLRSWRRKLLALDAEQAKVRERIEALAPQELPKGLGLV